MNYNATPDESDNLQTAQSPRIFEANISSKTKGGHINLAYLTPLGYENPKPYLFHEPIKPLNELINDQSSDRIWSQNCDRSPH